MTWTDFWNSDTPIYVNERHKLLHYRLIARDIIKLLPSREARVLDYGCGEALAAATIAAQCRTLTLVDAAPRVRDKLSERFAASTNIHVASPEDIAVLPAGSFDLVIINSVLQYLKKDEAASVFATLRDKLAPNGRLVLADILQPGVSPLTDVKALLGFGWTGGFLGAACLGLVRTALSDYRKLRGQLGLTHYSEGEIIAALAAAGFSARRQRPNIGHNQDRMLIIAEPNPAAAAAAARVATAVAG
ncbi:MULTISPECIES: class I SAM-dependent methyltransferase [unclassified Chelatococcus]|uniref:class I SAM-dependent methyltransferase n=1 Tax=unclassified Chelatococcus TaxID=2638111 RepID=UPI001BCC4838|nr:MULTISPECIES: class I SAM-dependent methyltransferase [unclassified Chelatococcus]MBS7697816.1 class I SAM-dependent methyltransferase [Chelatococcus sp. YT9]MBX3381847.1 class I SAM-dependent methyltransferase [Phycisphaeraceae bacterium]MBX3559755.1 class I SAM-dependent methyltransferase [Chelatococcus sp.]